MNASQLDLFGVGPDGQSNNQVEQSYTWPDPQRFPLNAKGQSVGQVVLEDLSKCSQPLIVAGYASLDRLIDFVSNLAPLDTERIVRVVIGVEPFESRTHSFVSAGHAFPEEVRSYWLERGISLHYSAKVVKVIEMIRAGRLKFRCADDGHKKLHAKIYASTEAVTLGSSNFTQNGLFAQLECNVRFHHLKDKRRCKEATLIAENFWLMGVDYNEELLRLLSELLKFVTWQEALARGCAELLEGEWARRYLEQQMDLGDTRLWPSQIAGIAQALWMVDNVGSVLIADPTGSGKTRMGAHLGRALVDLTWSKGRARHKGRRDLALLVCPPAVAPTWQKEAINCGFSLQIRSHGYLSHSDSANHDELISMVRRAQILLVDEAHNYLNLTSNRSRKIMGNLADSVVLFTATPINKGPSDLLSLVEMLGADNMEEDTLKVLEGLSRRRKLSDNSLSRQEIDTLRKEIQRFTLRRTKGVLNRLVDSEPHLYFDQHGTRCRYPKHESHIYFTEETEQDQALADAIRELASQLKGLALLENRIEVPEAVQREGMSDERYLSGRLLAVQHLSVYNVMSRLRSSKAALVEHLLGSLHANEAFGLQSISKKMATGNLIGKLRGKAFGPPPQINLGCPLPPWLTDAQAFKNACHDDLAIYTQILDRVKRMSQAREKAKARKVYELAGKHKLVLAFDSHLISLEVIRQELLNNPNCPAIHVATGADKAEKDRVMKQFARGSQQKAIALCSDSMSEGLNLQGASAILHLDMPSVVRVAEQRVGRVDRMDSQHTTIQAWWPKDSEAFALRADDRFVERYQTVETLLGSNMPLPEEIGKLNNRNALSVEQMIKDADAMQAEPWDGIGDAFNHVRELVYGSDAIVPLSVYEEYRTVSARVLSRVSLVKSRRKWAFFCIRGANGGAPKWVLLIEGSEKVHTSLSDISTRLRALLSRGVENLPMSEAASLTLDKFLRQLERMELHLLPRKKQRALHQMQRITTYMRDQSQKAKQHQLALRWHVLACACAPQLDRDGLDLDVVAETWLDAIRPHWHTRLGGRKKQRAPLILADIDDDLKNVGLDIKVLEDMFSSTPVVDRIDRRIAACIVGVGSQSS